MRGPQATRGADAAFPFFRQARAQARPPPLTTSSTSSATTTATIACTGRRGVRGPRLAKPADYLGRAELPLRARFGRTAIASRPSIAPATSPTVAHADELRCVLWGRAATKGVPQTPAAVRPTASVLQTSDMRYHRWVTRGFAADDCLLDRHRFDRCMEAGPHQTYTTWCTALTTITTSTSSSVHWLPTV